MSHVAVGADLIRELLSGGGDEAEEAGAAMAVGAAVVFAHGRVAQHFDDAHGAVADMSSRREPKEARIIRPKVDGAEVAEDQGERWRPMGKDAVAGVRMLSRCEMLGLGGDVAAVVAGSDVAWLHRAITQGALGLWAWHGCASSAVVVAALPCVWLG